MERTGSVMVVEDSETQGLRTQLILESEGWDVIRVASAEAALNALNLTVPDLILIDHNLNRPA